MLNSSADDVYGFACSNRKLQMAPRRKNLDLILTLTKRKTMLMSWVQKMNMKTRRELEYLATMLMMKMLMNNHTTMKIMVMMATDGAFCQRLIEALR